MNHSQLNRNSAGSGIFVFEADTAAFANRKRAARACASCQKRKKRCPHTFTKFQDADPNGHGVEKVLPHLTHKEPIRFVGDLNPESIMTDLETRDKGLKRFSRVGLWMEQSRVKAELLKRDAEIAAQNGHLPQAPPSDVVGGGSRHAQRSAVERYSKVERGRRTLTGHQKNYLQAVGAFRVLPKATEDALMMTYIACIDSLLPIIDGIKFLKDYSTGDASVFLVQAICLVACKTEEAVPYLRLYEDGPLLDPIPFARSLHTGLDAAMKADLEADRFTKVQIMTLMSLHNDGPGGIEESSSHLVQAIHDAQTTGMHIDTPGRTRNDQGAQLWWALWMLDKYNACLGGRPLMIAERDIDIQEPSPWESPKSQTMQIWMALGHLLDRVIEFYRPIADPDATGWEADFPTWTETIQGLRLDLLLKSHLDALEICYNIIGILACRSGGPSTISYNRRVACADRIQALVSDRNGVPLPPVPLIPYAVSLSLTVAYRGLRDHHTDPVKALADLTLRCEMLENFSSTWWTADAMAKLGRKALKSLQQPAQVPPLETQAKSNPGVADIGEALEAEVTPCKYWPFNDKSGAGSKSGGLNKRPASAGDNTAGATGNALHVLSDAAATHGNPPHGGPNKQVSQAEMNNDQDIQAKRRRLDPSRHSLHVNGASPATTTSNSDSNANTPTLIFSTATHTPSSFSNEIPRRQTQMLSNSSSTPITYLNHQHHNLGNANTNTAASMLTPNSTTSLDRHHSGPSIPLDDPMDTANLDPFTTFNPDPLAFIDLDNLFEGFVDLRLPTMFQDPLFDGEAFFSTDQEDYSFMDDTVPTTTSTGIAGGGGGGGDGSMDDMNGMGFVGGGPNNISNNSSNRAV